MNYEATFNKNIIKLIDVLKICVEVTEKHGGIGIDQSMLEGFKSIFQYTSTNKPKMYIEIFIRNTITKDPSIWKNIYEKNDNFFLNSSEVLFDKIDIKNIKLLKNLYFAKDSNGSSILDDDLKNALWSFMQSFVKTSIKFMITENKFNSNNYRYISFQDEAKKWKVSI